MWFACVCVNFRVIKFELNSSMSEWVTGPPQTLPIAPQSYQNIKMEQLALFLKSEMGRISIPPIINLSNVIKLWQKVPGCLFTLGIFCPHKLYLFRSICVGVSAYIHESLQYNGHQRARCRFAARMLALVGVICPVSLSFTCPSPPHAYLRWYRWDYGIWAVG